jgi:starvation-inducible outer membrane lipoprotein
MRTTYLPTIVLAGLLLVTACSSKPHAASVTTTATTLEQTITTAEVTPTDRAVVTGCHWDTDILERLGGGVINAINFSNHDTVELTLEDGTWWVTRLTINRQAEGIDECGGRP